MNHVRQTKRLSGFTLIELLVVIAIIALLLSVIMPALRRAKEAGKRSVCLFNTKSLTTGWLLYIQENHDQLPKAYTANDGWIRVVEGYMTNPEEAPVQLQIEAIEKGLLFPYLNTMDVYRCPIAKENELRTYSMTHALNGSPLAADYGGEVLTKINQIKNTGSRVVFLDDFIRDWDACWLIYNDREQWWNVTPARHGAGGNVFSFADAHSEYWSWADARTVALSKKCYEMNTPDARGFSESVQPGNEDIRRVQRSVWGKSRY
jgi:prepilin-type N-terminal cleavage/methylation domain-containing protein